MKRRIKAQFAPQPTENGSACLAMLAEYYGVRVSLFETAQKCGVTADGCTMEQIAEGAEALGFEAELRRADPVLLQKEKRPCIVTVDGSFAVLSGFSGRRAVLYTPDNGRVAAAVSGFAGSCGETALFLTPRSAPGERGKQRKPLALALSLILKQNLGPTVLHALILVGISLLLLGVSQLSGMITDSIYSGDYHLWAGADRTDLASLSTADVYSLFSLAGMVLVMIALLLLEIWIVPVFGRLSARISTQCRKRFMWPALNLPVDLYQIRSEGYFMSSARQTLNLGYFLSKEMVEVIVRPMMSLWFLYVMARVSVPCCLVALASAAVMVAVCVLSARYTNRMGRIVFARQSAESGFLLGGLKAIRSIRNSGSEFVFFRQYVGLNRRSAITAERNQKVRRTFDGLPLALGNITKLTLVLVGVMNVRGGRLSFGDLIFVHGIYCIVADYIRTAVYSGQSILSVRYQLENLGDIGAAAEPGETSEPGDAAEPAEAAESGTGQPQPLRKLQGSLRLEHVSFGYSRHTGPVVEDVTIDVPARSSVAIVGASGCGKTTLKKLICGRYEPWEGRILYDGRTAAELPKAVLENSIAAVDQQITLFEDSVMNNIKMLDTTQIDADAILAAVDAEIHDEIVLREDGYNAPIDEDGGNFSGGERQRIEIARALSMDPTILVLDEATSALDTIVEKRIVENLRRRGVTTVVIAHRLSTIRGCDCIYVMDRGRIAARGTHDELMRTSELYRTLVTVE